MEKRKKFAESYNIDCSFEANHYPKMDEIPTEKIDSALLECAKLFQIEDIIKYAQRQEVTPVKPKENRQNERGFTCSMAIIVALQTAYVMEKVPAVNNKWCSNKHEFFAKPLAIALANQNSSSEEYKSILKNLIPEELRLSSKMTGSDLFARSILKGNSFVKLGKLIAPRENLLLSKSVFDKGIKEAIEAGQEKKEIFRMNVLGK